MSDIDNIDLAAHPGLLDLWMNHARRALKLVPHCRYYSFTEEQVRGIACQLAVWQRKRAVEGGESYTDPAAADYLAKLLQHCPGSLQDWRPPDEQKKIKWPIDPLTGRPVNIEDQTSLNLLAREDPNLYAEIKRRQASGGVLTYKQLLEDQKAAEARKVLKGLEYTEATHTKNPFISGTISQQMQFAKAHPRLMTDAYKAEAKTRPTIPWHSADNLTLMMAITKVGLRDLVDAGAQIERQWIDREQEQLRQVAEENARKSQVNAQLLGVKK